MSNPMSKFKIALASGTLALSMLPGVGWSTRLYAAPIAGQITALPTTRITSSREALRKRRSAICPSGSKCI